MLLFVTQQNTFKYVLEVRLTAEIRTKAGTDFAEISPISYGDRKAAPEYLNIFKIHCIKQKTYETNWYIGKL